MPLILDTAEKIIAQTNVAEKLANNRPIKDITIQAKLDNAASVFVGSATSQKIELEPGDSIQLSIIDDAEKIYIKGTAGDGVNYIYEF